MVNKSIFLAIVLLAGCAKSQEDFLADEGPSVFKAYADVDSVEADGKSTITILGSVRKDANLRVVSFVTNKGSFSDSNKTFTAEAAFVDTAYVATALLVSSLEPTDNVLVRASVPKINRDISIKFLNAYPDSLVIQSPLGNISREFGATLPLSIYLLRKIGIPSLYQTVALRTEKPDGSKISMSIDAMDPGGSDNKGLIKANLILKDTTYKGPIVIVATTQGKTKPISNSFTIFITEKKE